MSDFTELPAGALPDDGDRPLEPLLRTLAESYHRPPPTPREAMWTAIRAARDADRTLTGPAVEATSDVVALPPVALVVTAAEAREAATGARVRRGRAATGRRWAGPIAALAAALLLGIGLGRWTTRSGGSSGVPVGGVGPNAVASAGEAAAPDAAAGATAQDAVSGAPPHSDDRSAPADARNPNVASGTTTPLPASRLAAAEPEAAPGALAPETDAARIAGTYRVATVQHLGQAEALLTTFRAEPGAGVATAAATDAWARELLTTTRLLLDSPAAADPQLGPLLGDLEAVLVQIVHLPAARAAGERQLIAQSLDQSQLMTHLRAAVPAGPAAPQRSGE